MRSAQATGYELLAVIPVGINGESSCSINISNFFETSGDYYVAAKAVGSTAEVGARDMSFGRRTNSNTVIYRRPGEELSQVQNVCWGTELAYGRATWDEVANAAGYQVMLYSGEKIVASRNINTTHFDFSSGWIDFDQVAEKEYCFTVTALSGNIREVANGPESERSALLAAPGDENAVRILTEPASKYVAMGTETSVSIRAAGIGLTYQWTVDGEPAGQEDDVSIQINTDETGVRMVSCVVHDALGNSEASQTARVTVLDDTPVEHMITLQPEDRTVDPNGQDVYFSVGTGAEDYYLIEYTWFESTDNGATWTERMDHGSFVRTAAYPSKDGMQYQCRVKVTSPTGAMICEEMSEIATLHINQQSIAIIRNLDSEYWTDGEDYLYIGAVAEEGELTYQWYVDGNSWPGATENLFDLDMLTGRETDAEMYCLLTAGEHTRASYTTTVHIGENPATGISIRVLSGVQDGHLAVEDRLDLLAILLPEKATSNVVWSSSNPAAATVTDWGTVRAVGFGETVITATAGNVSDTYHVSVDSYRVTYDPAGGRFPDGSTMTRVERVIAGEQATMPVVWLEGDTFLGWTLEENLISSLSPTEDVTLYARWEQSTAQEDPEIAIEQDLAENQYARIGTDAKFEVVTNGAKVLKYEWQVSTNGGTEWSRYGDGVADGRKTSLQVAATAENNGWKFRVVITGYRERKTVTSSVCTLLTGTGEEPEIPEPFHFTLQPVDVTCRMGESVTFTVAVDVTGARYQWYLGDTKIIGASKATFVIDEVMEDYEGEYSCVVTVGKDSRTSAKATLTIVAAVTFDANGGRIAGTEEETVTRDVTVGTQFAVTETAEREGYRFDGWYLEGMPVGSTVEVTGDITLMASWTEEDPAPEITQDLAKDYYPQSMGEGFVIQATGQELHYRWQTRATEEDEWTDVGEDQNTYTPTLTETDNGRQVRCEIRDEGYDPATSATSSVATFHWIIPAESVWIEKVSGEECLVPDDEVQLKAVVLPENTTEKEETWTSNNESVATVDSTGKVLVVGTGDAAITAKVGQIVSAPYEITVNHVLVTYDAAGGTVEPTEERAAIGLFTPALEPVRKGYVFDGWKLTAEDEEVIESLTLTENTTLTASWTEEQKWELTVTVEDQSGMSGDVVNFVADAVWERNGETRDVTGAEYQWQRWKNGDWESILPETYDYYSLMITNELDGARFRVIVTCEGEEASDEAELNVDIPGKDPLDIFIQSLDIHEHDDQFQLEYGTYNGDALTITPEGNYAMGTFTFSRSLTESEMLHYNCGGTLTDSEGNTRYDGEIRIFNGALDEDMMWVPYEPGIGGVFLIDFREIPAGIYDFQVCYYLGDVLIESEVWEVDYTMGPEPAQAQVTIRSENYLDGIISIDMANRFDTEELILKAEIDNMPGTEDEWTYEWQYMMDDSGEFEIVNVYDLSVYEATIGVDDLTMAMEQITYRLVVNDVVSNELTFILNLYENGEDPGVTEVTIEANYPEGDILIQATNPDANQEPLIITAHVEGYEGNEEVLFFQWQEKTGDEDEFYYTDLYQWDTPNTVAIDLNTLLGMTYTYRVIVDGIESNELTFTGIEDDT